MRSVPPYPPLSIRVYSPNIHMHPIGHWYSPFRRLTLLTARY
jgi:hypothetical protein